ncbi:hypothetical protein EYR41_007649 [Orbilia oligospora]|uniref:Uncharacterized protein n=1 Tax=Orbilia oligospora TaxID=2813651 RepID=A0A7C8TUP4_ORBOL|nr:hypothetical protein TWF751_008286 [Orbilia oligospora]TGJ68607.1 hypothetical protein EYR41_007649 [Orbilia oligospora]
MLTSPPLTYNYILTSLVALLLLPQSSICPKPDEIISSALALTNPKLVRPILEFPNEPKVHYLPMTAQQYENWVFENSQTLSYIALQMEWLEQLRNSCPLGPSPSISGQPGARPVSPRSLAFLIRTLKATITSFQEDIVTMSRPVGDLYDVGKLIRETLGWSKNEAPTQAWKVVDTIKGGISQMRTFWEQYSFLEKESREDWVGLPKDDLSERVIFVATRIAQPVPADVEEGNGNDEIRLLNVDADSIAKKIETLQAQLKWMKHAVKKGEEWAQVAEDRQLDNPVYTQMLDRKKYDPDHKPGIRNLDFNLINIFKKAVRCVYERSNAVEGSPYQLNIIDNSSPELEEILSGKDVKVQEDEEQWSSRPMQQSFLEDTILKEEDEAAVLESYLDNEVKVEGGHDQWSTRPINQDYLEDIIFKEEEGAEVGQLMKEDKLKNPGVMSLEDIEDQYTTVYVSGGG